MTHLDLTLFDNNTWDVTLPNGEVVNIKKPTQKMFILLEQKIKRLGDDGDDLEQLERLIELAEFILSNNKGDVKISKEALESLTLGMLNAIYTGYMKFVNEIVANPN